MRRLLAIATVLVALLAGPACGSAAAAFGFAPGGNSLEILDSNGTADHLAGSHPDKVVVKFAFNTKEGTAEGNARTLLMELPPGFVGNAAAVPTCSRSFFDQAFFTEEECPPQTRVGSATFTVAGEEPETKPIFNIEPAPGRLAELGVVNGTKIPMPLKLRPSDLGVTIEQSELLQGAPVIAGEVELWGIPFDHQEAPQGPRAAFLTLPTTCSGAGVAMKMVATSWQSPASVETTVTSAGPLDGCQELAFHPSLSLGLTDPQVDSPTGVNATVSLPAKEGPDEPSEGVMRSLRMEMPEGVSVSPGGLAQRESCTEAEFQANSCPARSRIGEAALASPLLDRTVGGAVFLGEDEGGHRFPIYVWVASGEISAKLKGTITVTPSSGRLVVELPELPQIPLDKATIAFEGGPGALLVTPLACGGSTADGRAESYGGNAATLTATVQTGPSPAGAECPGDKSFKPGVVVGTSSRVAGSSSSLRIYVSRRSGEPPLKKLSVTLPPGVTAALGSVQPCSSSQAEAGACPAMSRIGSAAVGLGSGESVVTLQGTAFLTKEAGRFGMALVVPAQIGPYDLGTVVLRAAIGTNLLTGVPELEVAKLPQTIEGVSVRIRSLAVDVDRQGFIRNPTSCRPLSATAALGSSSGATWTVKSPFQVDRCERLGFDPKVGASLSGSGNAEKLTMKIKMAGKSTALAGMAAPLPPEFHPNARGVSSLCSRTGANLGNCPKSARVGDVELRTPLFSKPLHGFAYAVQPQGKGRPEIWTILSGSGVKVALMGSLARKGHAWVVKLDQLPDMPISAVRMEFDVNGHGAISTPIACGRKRHTLPAAGARFSGQDGAVSLKRLAIAVLPCS